MATVLDQFEEIVRRAGRFTEEVLKPPEGFHPFEERNIHSSLPETVLKLFDDGHFSQASFEAFKFLDKEVQRHSNNTESGFKLMMKVFSESTPSVGLTPCISTSEKDEQKGFQFLFAGSVLAIRNPRGHELSIKDTPDQCLDHLALVSLLLRQLEDAGYFCEAP